jgi:NAD(P)-dependent dehydrogenase (short-subunit alcohol dehydrogenase family)
MNSNLQNKKVWFVTGASKGLGLTLTKQLLGEGYRVAATSRNSEALIKAVGGQSDNFLPLEMDLINEESVSESIRKTLASFGKINVVVNNAGYGQIGTLEELSDEEARQNFDVNVFGFLNVIRHVMPHLRAKQSGHVFNISSIGGYSGFFAGWGIYCATKFAIAGFTESLAAEAKPFGVTATVVYPGYFRTDFLSKDSVGLPKNPIAEYEEARKTEDLHQNEIDGNQMGDPEKAAAVLVKIASEANPPLHLFLGSDAYNLANAKISAVQEDLKSWKELATSTDFEVQSASVG